MSSGRSTKAEKKERQPSLQGPPAGLMKALEDTGRVRGSSATPRPAVLSPVPTGGKSFHEHIQKMSRLGLTEPLTGKVNTKSGNSNDNNVSESSDGSGAGGSSSSLTPTKALTVKSVAEEFESRLNKLISIVQQAKLPTHVQKDLIAEIRSIGEDFRDHQKRLEEQVNRLNKERDHFKDRLVDTAKHLQAITADRDHIRDEAAGLRRSLENLRNQFNQKEIDIITAAQEFKDEIGRLTQKLNTQGEQLKGKRALWLESNPGTSARRSAMNTVYDPFNSPTVPASGNFSPGQGSGTASQMQTPSVVSPALNGSNFQSSASSPQHTTFDSSAVRAPPPKMALQSIPETRQVPRRRAGLPHLKPRPAADYNTTHFPSPTSRGYTTEPGDTPINPNYGAMVLYNKAPDHDPSPEFMEDFKNLFVAMEGWVKDHANVGNPANDDNLMKNQILWEFMMGCTYPGNRKDAHTHTLALIKDRGCRYWFVMRMIASYIFNEMLAVDAWRGFSDETDRDLKDVVDSLARERGMANETRQKHIEKRAATIRSIIDHPRYQEWRARKLHDHTKELRNMLGPMLNPGSDRAHAGRDLGVLAIRGWDQSAKNNAAPYTFQTYFPETNSKFSAGSMIARDRPGIDPTHLQIKQVRVKLVITPVITLRDDGGTTIKARSLHFATVLLMG